MKINSLKSRIVLAGLVAFSIANVGCFRSTGGTEVGI